MTINEFINRAEIERNNKELQLETLEEIAFALRKYSYQEEIKKISDNVAAMHTFSEMFTRDIMPIQSAVLAFYFASKVTNDNTQNKDIHSVAYYLKARMIFKNMEFYFDYLDFVKTSFYKGDLEDKDFFDLFLLANVYKAMNCHMSDIIFEKIKAQVPQVEATHPTFDKNTIIRKGLEVSDAYYNFMDKHIIGNQTFIYLPTLSCI